MTVLNTIIQFATEQCGCDPDMVSMATLLDDLNMTRDDRCELAFLLDALYTVEIPVDEMEGFETVEDVVGYIEDRM